MRVATEGVVERAIYGSDIKRQSIVACHSDSALVNEKLECRR